MKCAVLILLALSRLAAARALQDSWQPVTSSEGCFAIKMPSAPTEQHVGGGVTYTLREGDDLVLWVTSLVLQPKHLAIAPAELLPRIRDSVLRQTSKVSEQKLLTSTPGTFEGHPSLTFVQDAQAPGRPPFRMKGTLVHIGARVVAIGYAGKQTSFRDATFDSFLASFHILDPMTGSPTQKR